MEEALSVELSIQVAIRSRLVTTPEVTALVPAGNILDRSARPIIDPSIIIGEGQMVDEGDTIDRTRMRVYSTVHIWKQEVGLREVKAIAWAIRTAMRRGRLELGSKFHCVDCFVSSNRAIRDPDGETAHAIVTIETVAEEVA